MHRSLSLTLLLLLSSLTHASGFCAFPGRDGDARAGGVVNLWLAAPQASSLPAGSRTLEVADGARGSGSLQAGDLLLLVQMQGASIDPRNSDAYGDGTGGDGRGRGWRELRAGHFEFLRLEKVDGRHLRVRGAGPNGGLVGSYLSRQPASGSDPGAATWQLVRVPQYDNLTLTGDLFALPWNGRNGGVLAVDVRNRLALAGHRLSVDGAGFRGGGALSLAGALGDERDYVYRAPGIAELGAGFGQHASKGEGVAGTPRWVAVGDDVLDTRPMADRFHVSDGYPGGSMARGAPANAGGGGQSLTADNTVPSGGGGGGGGRAGGAGLAADGSPRGGEGGAAIAPDLLRVVAGGGGGAGTRASGGEPEGNGGAGGGILLVRAGVLAGPGLLSARGAGGGQGSEAGGGGGAGGTVWIEGRVAEALPAVVLDGGAGGRAPAAGGDGGGGRLLTGGGLELPRPRAGATFEGVGKSDAPGALPAWRCRPSGMLLAGTVFDDNGVGAGAAHDGRKHRDEGGITGRKVTVTTREGEPVAAARTSAAGQFALEVDPRWAGRELRLHIDIPDGWRAVAARAEDLPLAPFRYLEEGAWAFTAVREYQQDGLLLGLVREPELRRPARVQLEAGKRQFLAFRYVAHTAGRVRFRYAAQGTAARRWQHAFFLDTNCDAASEYVERGVTAWVPVSVGDPVCVRVRVDVPEDLDPTQHLVVQVDAETDLGPTPLGLRLEPLRARITAAAAAPP